MFTSRFGWAFAGTVALGPAAFAEGLHFELYGSAVSPSSLEFCDPTCADYDTQSRSGFGVGLYSSRLLPGSTS